MSYSTTAPLSASPARPAPVAGTPRDNRPLAALLLAAAVAGLAVLADQLIGTWADEHLLAAWLTLWAVAFAGSLLLAGTARRTAQRLQARLDAWASAKAQARAEARFQRLVASDPRLKAAMAAAQKTPV